MMTSQLQQIPAAGETSAQHPDSGSSSTGSASTGFSASGPAGSALAGSALALTGDLPAIASPCSTTSPTRGERAPKGSAEPRAELLFAGSLTTL